MDKIIGVCGLTCTECPAYQATLKDDDKERKRVAEMWSKEYGAEIKPEDINCDGCTVLEATGGMEAIRKARRRAPDVIVTDLRMPGISGVETARLLAGLPGTRCIPRIAITVEPPDHVSDEDLGGLFLDVLRKPFAPAHLRATVRDAASA